MFFQGFLTPLCNMSIEDGKTLFNLLREHISLEQVQIEVTLISISQLFLLSTM